jgi:hypothetical protein
MADSGGRVDCAIRVHWHGRHWIARALVMEHICHDELKLRRIKMPLCTDVRKSRVILSWCDEEQSYPKPVWGRVD